MKKILVVAALLLCVFPSQTAFAGTVMAGFKGWYTYHDAWVIDLVRARAEANISASPLLNAASTGKSGNGFLGGGLLGYQTDDKRWSISFAFMVLSKFENSVSASGTLKVPPPDYNLVDVTFDIAEKRKDYDAAVNYSLSDFFKIFIGYKYMSLNYKLNYTVDYTLPAPGPDYSSRYLSESSFHIPTAGIGIVLPLSQYFILGAQAGILYAVAGKGTTKDEYEGTTKSEDFKRNFGYNVELNISLVIAQRVIFQAGYRQQYYKVEGSSSGSLIDSKDLNRGVTFSAIYLFNI